MIIPCTLPPFVGMHIAGARRADRAVLNPDETFLPALKRLWEDYKRGLQVARLTASAPRPSPPFKLLPVAFWRALTPRIRTAHRWA